MGKMFASSKMRYNENRVVEHTMQNPIENIPDSKAHGANMGPTWGPRWAHVGHVNLAIWDILAWRSA